MIQLRDDRIYNTANKSYLAYTAGVKCGYAHLRILYIIPALLVFSSGFLYVSTIAYTSVWFLLDLHMDITMMFIPSRHHQVVTMRDWAI